MKPKTIVFTIAFCLMAASVSFAANLQLGTWKLNEGKSKIPAGAPKNHTVIYEAAGNSVKVTVDGTNTEGQATHNEWTGMFDGKDYAVTGDPTSDTRAYRRVNSRTLTFNAKKDGKVTLTGRVVISANGKTRTVTTWGTNAQGQKIKSMAVYDKE